MMWQWEEMSLCYKMMQMMMMKMVSFEEAKKTNNKIGDRENHINSNNK